jgi:biopolymer transport protein TolQ
MIQFANWPGPFAPAALSQRRRSDVPEGRLRTLGSWFPALLLQAQSEAAPGQSTWSFVEIIVNATTITKVVLVVLALFSILSWAIVLFKAIAFRRAASQSATFLDVFRRSSKFSEVQAVCKSLANSPLVGLFQSGYAELTAQLRQSTPNGEPSAAANPRPAAGRPTLRSLTAVDRALMRASVVEVNKLEKRIPFLATTASITPFIGLFGTVVGILISFETIGQMGSANLAVVGPGIAEALVATAAGLATAIPAAYFYNHLTNRVKLFASEMDDFAMEFLNIAERNFT